jgi:hypothetical protein
LEVTATLKDLKKRARELGAKVEDTKVGETHECRVEAPYRKLWACDEIHELVDSAYRPWKPAYDDLLSRMAHGLSDCTDPDCEWCDPYENDT